jgi:hypothetical protein
MTAQQLHDLQIKDAVTLKPNSRQLLEGCYSSQLGDIEQAKARVGKAIELDAKFKMLALDDPDLVLIQSKKLII